MTQWTVDHLAAAATLTPREFEAMYPGEFSPAAVHIKRRLMRDQGIDVARAQNGRIPDPVVYLPEMPEKPSEDDLWNAYDAMYDLKLKHDTSKTLFDVDVLVETDRPFGVVFMSDFHIGSSGVDTKQLREDVELINSCANLKAYIGGDGIDNFVPTALANVHRDTALVSIDLQMELFKTIVRRLLDGDSLLAVGTGNHDAWTKKVAGIDASLGMLGDIPCLHTGEESYLNLTVGNQEYVIYRKHRPTRSSQFNDGHGIQHLWRFGERPFDVGVLEHHHTPFMGTFYGHGLLRWGIRTGAYKIRDSWSREFGFTNGGVGTPVVVLHPFRRMIIPFMDISAAIDYIDAYSV